MGRAGRRRFGHGSTVARTLLCDGTSQWSTLTRSSIGVDPWGGPAGGWRWTGSPFLCPPGSTNRRRKPCRWQAIYRQPVRPRGDYRDRAGQRWRGLHRCEVPVTCRPRSSTVRWCSRRSPAAGRAAVRRRRTARAGRGCRRCTSWRRRGVAAGARAVLASPAGRRTWCDRVYVRLLQDTAATRSTSRWASPWPHRSRYIDARSPRHGAGHVEIVTLDPAPVLTVSPRRRACRRRRAGHAGDEVLDDQFPTMPFVVLGDDVAHRGFNEWNEEPSCRGSVEKRRIGLDGEPT